MRIAASFRPLPFLPRPMAYSAERFAQSSSSASCCPKARRIALVTMRSSSGTDLEGSSAANRSATLWRGLPVSRKSRYLNAALYGQGKSVRIRLTRGARSRTTLAAPTTLPSLSLMGKTVTETFITEPSLRLRTVSW